MGINLSGRTPTTPGAPGGILQAIFDGVGDIGEALAEGLMGIVGLIADALFGPGDGPPIVRLSDGMTELNERVELLDDVPGYAGAYMGTNRRFGLGAAFKTIPFDRPYGPPKRAHLDTATNRLVMETGSWSIHFTIVAAAGPASPFQVTVGHSVRARIRDKDGNVKIDRPFEWGHIGNWEHAKHFAMPIIVPPETAPWSVELGYRHNEPWWTLTGGTDKTLAWVERKNMDTDNAEIVTDVPDGPDIT